jgi:protocatechuate 3,4-dioxygenase beta subunit
MIEEHEMVYGGYGRRSVSPTGPTLPGGLAVAGAQLLAAPPQHLAVTAQPLVAATTQPLAATPQSQDHDATPLAIEGPYYKRLSPRRFDLREPTEMGRIVELTGTVMTRSGQPFPGAVVDLWHANPNGDYDNAGFRYRGNTVTDAHGRYRFLTIKPGAYGSWADGTGRTVHYHVIVRAPNVWPFTTQFYFPNEPDNYHDDYFRHDLVMRVAQAGEGFTAAFDIVLETYRTP